MKILEIIPSLNSGGAERFVVDLSNELSKKYDVCLISLYELIGPDKFYQDEILPNVSIISLKKRRGFDIRILSKLRKIIDEYKPDIIHTHTRAFDYLFLISILYHKVRFFHTVHSDAKKEASGKFDRLLRFLAFRTKLFIPVTISNESHSSFLKYYKIDAPLIYNGRNIDKNLIVSSDVISEVESYKNSPETKVVVCLAHISPVKRQTVLAKVINKLYNEGFDITLLLIGRKDNRDMVEEIESMNSKCIFMLGTRHNPLEYLKYSGYYSLVSEYEGMPISLIESLGVGAIPLCTPVGGITNVIKDKVNGYVSNDISEQSIYEMFLSFLKTPSEDLDVIKHRTLESYKVYSMNNCALNYINLFQQ